MNDVLKDKNGSILNPKIPRYEKKMPIVVYENTNGSNSNINLIQSIENAEFIDVEFKNNNNIFNNVRVYDPVGKQVILFMAPVYNAGQTGWIQSSQKTITATQILNDSEQAGQIELATNNMFQDANYIVITKVIAFY